MRDELMRLMLDNPLDYPVGDHYEYSNAGYSMLAAIIEIVSGMDYEQFLQRNLFKPSGMMHTGLRMLSVPDSLISHSHNQMLGYPSPADRPDNCWHLIGNGGILSTTADMYRWHQALHEGDLLSDEARKKLFTPYVREYEDGESFYGYGWVIDHYGEDSDLIWHNGGAMPHGWSCADYYFVTDNTFMIVFANKPMSGAMPVDAIVEDLAQLMLGIEFAMPPEVIDLPPEQLGPHVGRYTATAGSGFEVSRAGAGLFISGGGQSALDLLFPSPYAARLPKYNDRTDTLVNLLAAGDYEATVPYFDDRVATADEWVQMSKEWWASFDSLGDYRNVSVIGTRVSKGAQTYCRIDFAGGSVVCRFFWMGGRCGGIVSEVELPGIVVLPQSNRRFVSFNLMTGSIVAVEFGDDGSLTVNSDGNSLTAQR